MTFSGTLFFTLNQREPTPPLWPPSTREWWGPSGADCLKWKTLLDCRRMLLAFVTFLFSEGLDSNQEAASRFFTQSSIEHLVSCCPFFFFFFSVAPPSLHVAGRGSIPACSAHVRIRNNTWRSLVPAVAVRAGASNASGKAISQLCLDD